METEITIRELLERIDTAASGMSVRNPNRILFEQCKVAIVFLAERVSDAQLPYSGRIVLP